MPRKLHVSAPPLPPDRPAESGDDAKEPGAIRPAEGASPSTPSGDQAPPRIEVRPLQRGYDVDGVTLPRVTDIIKAGLPNPVLGMWFRKVVAEEAIDNLEHYANMLEVSGRDETLKWLKGAPMRNRDKAGAQGTQLHAIAEDALRGVTSPLLAPDELLPETLQNLTNQLDSCLQKIQALGGEWTAIEQQAISVKYGYAGTFDAILEVPPEHAYLFGVAWPDPDREEPYRFLVDWKTSKGVYESFGLQLAAYRWAEFHRNPETGETRLNGGRYFDGALVAQIRPDFWGLHYVSTTRRDFEAFLAAKEVGEWKRAFASTPSLSGSA